MKDATIDKPVLIVIGPTAIGKTALSLHLAHRFDCEIISVDSMQVYRHMDIGTAKVTAKERAEVKHHLIDIKNPDEAYDAAQFTRDSLKIIREIHERGKLPLLTGGTGLYLKALISGLFQGAPVDEKIRDQLRQRLAAEGAKALHEELTICDRISANKIHKNDTHRLLRALEIYHASGIPWSVHLDTQKKSQQEVKLSNTLQIGLTCDRTDLYDRINLRTGIMLKNGLEEEVKGLMGMGYSSELKSMGSIGYRHMCNYIAGIWSYREMTELLARDTRRYAKRQITWFKQIDGLLWRDPVATSEIMGMTDKWLESR